MTTRIDRDNFYWHNIGREQCSCGQMYNSSDTMEGCHCPACGKRTQYTVLSTCTLDYDQVFQAVGKDLAQRSHREKQAANTITMQMAGAIYAQELSL